MNSEVERMRIIIDIPFWSSSLWIFCCNSLFFAIRKSCISLYCLVIEATISLLSAFSVLINSANSSDLLSTSFFARTAWRVCSFRITKKHKVNKFEIEKTKETEFPFKCFNTHRISGNQWTELIFFFIIISGSSFFPCLFALSFRHSKNVVGLQTTVNGRALCWFNSSSERYNCISFFFLSFALLYFLFIFYW